MNQKQIELIKHICDEMYKPFLELIDTPKYSDLVNEDGGEYMPIVVSILASLLTTSINNWISTLEIEKEEIIDTFVKTLFVVAHEAKEGFSRHLERKREMH